MIYTYLDSLIVILMHLSLEKYKNTLNVIIHFVQTLISML